MNLRSLAILISGYLAVLMAGCRSEQSISSYQDSPFEQEYHQPFSLAEHQGANDVRRIAVDSLEQVWVATADGIYKKGAHTDHWTPVDTTGPAYCLSFEAQQRTFVGNWSGLWQIHDQALAPVPGVTGPITQLCQQGGRTYAMGPAGLWKSEANGFVKIQADFPRSVRDLVPDKGQGLWIASDVGLYHWSDNELKHYYTTQELVSGYAKAVAYNDQGQLWVGGLGGVTIRMADRQISTLTPKNGLPSRSVSQVRMAPDSTMWVGTDQGVVRYRTDGSHSLLFSRRWLLDDQVRDIAFDRQGNAWIATAQGVSRIGSQPMTLAQKQDYFYEVLMKRHIRAPWTAGIAHLTVAGDTSTWQPEDDDNDGEFTGNYLAMESFRYAVTKDPLAKERAQKAFRFMKLLGDITETDGFFARAIIPIDWTEMHDKNRTYTPQEIAEEQAKEPRFKPVTERWRPSSDGKWLWKGDTSSDEMCGHMFGYYHYYTLVADKAEKKVVSAQITKIVDHLIRNHYNLVDVDGKPTRWSVWSPESLNRDPEWLPDRNQNSMELLSFLKLAYHTSGDQKYEKEYRRLIEEEGYLQNMSKIGEQNPAWFIYFDVILQAYQYPILLHCEQDPELRAFYEAHLEKWYEKRRADHNPLINFIYNFALNKKEGLQPSISFLKDTPLDLVDWPIDHSQREDITLSRYPSLEEQQVGSLPPASIRSTVRWDVNPWSLKGGDPHREREPVFWLLPYWMGRYLHMIQEPNQ
ncbi:hypothetical protein CLV98_106242 [Dyadobacter jejuensis]|uniref:Two component regulator with propeller domain n=1 Tax=Dyadobacter jejuensis TaxID=1082580 RepID=A0A316ALS2_9BACT|nr:regulator [Dyadobacter jejuensis]PWJ57770.1 hypothetical protein CLV98_106242 [Dyadobacter jejuensis]